MAMKKESRSSRKKQPIFIPFSGCALQARRSYSGAEHPGLDFGSPLGRGWGWVHGASTWREIQREFGLLVNAGLLRSFGWGSRRLFDARNQIRAGRRGVLPLLQRQFHRALNRQAHDALAAKEEGPQGNVAYRVALVHAWRGERDSAFEWLERAYARHDLELRWLKIDPFLRNLRADPRYTALLRKMNLPLD